MIQRTASCSCGQPGHRGFGVRGTKTFLGGDASRGGAHPLKTFVGLLLLACASILATGCSTPRAIDAPPGAALVGTWKVDLRPTPGAVRIAFVTADGSGRYKHSAVLQDGRLEGLSNSTGRDFLSYWSATRN